MDTIPPREPRARAAQERERANTEKNREQEAGIGWGFPSVFALRIVQVMAAGGLV